MFYDPTCKPELLPEVKLEPWRQLLLDAADVVEQRGHCQHALSEGGGVCLYGALNVADHGNVNWVAGVRHDEATVALTRVLGTCNRWRNVDWNNSRGRTKAEVVNALRKAAAV